METVKLEFPENQYIAEETKKDKIVLHHTVSGPGINGDISWWKQTKDRVATSYIIDREGVIYEVFPDKYWAHHLGVTKAQLSKFNSKVSNETLNKTSVGIEIDSWGWLEKKDGKFYAGNGKEIDSDKVIILDNPYRGHKYFEKYTPQQIKSVVELVNYLCNKYEINYTYHDNMFEFNKEAINGEPGLWSHTSYRPDKTDIYPDPELIDQLKSLRSYCKIK